MAESMIEPKAVNPLFNSRPLDVHRWSEFPEVKKAVEDLYVELGFNNVNYKRILRVVLLDLYHSWRTDHTQYVTYSRGENEYRGGTRYNKLRIKYDLLINTVDALVDAGYVEQWLGQYYRNEDKSTVGFHTRMRATKMLIRCIVIHKVKPKMISRYADEEHIVLRDVPEDIKKGKKTITIKKDIEDYKDNTYVTKIRKDLKAYNALLAKTYIDVDDENLTDSDAELLRSKEYALDLSRKTVHRVFNNNSWNEAGRFYGAWWMDCPKVLRKYILLNGDPTVELDYSGVHIHFLYAIEKINYSAENEDPYTLAEYPNRGLNKNIMLVALNANNDEDCIKGVWNNIRKESKKYGITNHKQLKDILTAIKAKHIRIKKYIASGYGVKLQNYDARIAEQVIQYFTSRNIPILSVHDSFICSSLDEHTLRDQMELLYVKQMKKFLNLSYESTMEEVHYDRDTVERVSVNDNIISVDRKALDVKKSSVPELLKMYSQGKRQLKWMLTGTTVFLGKVSNIEYTGGI